MPYSSSNPLNLNKSHYQEPPKRGLFFSLFFLLLMVILLPVAVYLANHQTNLVPQAAVPTPSLGETSLALSSSQLSLTPNQKAIISVYFKSDTNPANLIYAKINFPKDLVEVQPLPLSSSKLPDPTNYFPKKWLVQSFDNNQGLITLLATITPPGLQTKIDQKYLLTQFILQAKTPGPLNLAFDSSSAIYDNSNNLNILISKKDLLLQISASPQSSLPQESSPSSTFLSLTSPQAGQAFLYNSTLPITWQTNSQNPIQISLLLNDQLLGNIATTEAQLNQFILQPQKFIAPALINPLNSFKILLSTLGPDNLSSQSSGPFEILNLFSLPEIATDSASLDRLSADFKKDDQLNLQDLSVLQSHLGSSDKKYDLNQDGLVNDLDTYLLYQLIK